MATMVTTTSPQVTLPMSNGHAVKETEDTSPGDGVRIDSNGLQQEAYDDAHNQSAATPGKARAAADLPSSKNVIFASNGSNTPEAQIINYDDTSRAPSRAELPNGNNGDQHQESDQNGAAPDPAHETACNGHSGEDSQEKLDFIPVLEPQELAGAFSPTFGHPSRSHGAEDQSTNYPPASHPTKSPSRPSSPYVQGQDVHINGPQPGNEGVEAAASTTTSLRSASFQSAKGECGHQHQEHSHTVLTSTSHPQSQFLLTISAPSPAPSQSGQCYESSETGQSYQLQSTHVGEAPQPMSPSKDACQVPECVMNRASAGMGPVAGGAQLEHLLARVRFEKTVSRARAWEEGAKAKAYNRYTRDESKITAWENTMKSKAEASMRKAQENLDKQRAKHVEKMKNAVASAHCKAQEKRAAMEARRAEDIVKAEETASRIRATGKMPRRCLCVPV